MSLNGPDDLVCQFSIDFPPPYVQCHWTYKKVTGTATNSSAKIVNPVGGAVGNLYLYKRTALYAYLVTPGKPDKKISVPAGTDTISFTHAG